MLITIPASAGGAVPTSVLALEPLLDFAGQCRPDAVSLMPPIGPDDQPNGAALSAMKERLENAGLQVVAGTWETPADAPVADPGWQTEQAFEARALLSALGEAGVGPLSVHWSAPLQTGAHHDALLRIIDAMLEEAARSRIVVALDVDAARAGTQPVTEVLKTEWLALSCRVDEPGTALRWLERDRAELHGRLVAIHLDASALEQPGEDLKVLFETLGTLQFTGPVIVDGVSAGIDTVAAVGYLRGLRDALAPAAPPLRVVSGSAQP
jgi:hypothetical protein